ncbi:SoxR reducing system RseC family protein [Chitinophaga sancti]|uniref:SoxR reducing system RseC family protein n=1 Tax=Chitinophaga sancti TaxID=1004 RepID=UPI002A765195|nr:SoxR reducing system RseC family protein [Chitinophaga sancti]WPQ60814.1 SoxR reducing system RseC family protein [Chitinophaga sancti]
MKKDTRENIMIAVLIFLAIISRVITNHLQLWNFNAIGAAALFGGMMIRNKRLAYLLPVLTLFLSDLFLQFFTNVQTFYGAYIGQLFFVYGAFLLITWIATRIKKADALTILIASIGSGMVFFMITNLGTFLTTNLYPHTLSGLIACYAAGIPFYKEGDLFSSFALNGILGNVFFSAVLFGALSLIKQISYQPKKQQLA